MSPRASAHRARRDRRRGTARVLDRAVAGVLTAAAVDHPGEKVHHVDVHLAVAKLHSRYN